MPFEHPSLPALALPAEASTLLIPLAARAHGDAMFPEVAVHDRHAAGLLRTLQADVRPFLADRPSLYGVLARTHVFRDQAHAFFARHPQALGVSLGSGLAHYFQWLDNGRNRWLDADLPEVTALRDELLPARPRCRNAAFDLSRPGWWQRLGLPGPRARTPLLLMCEGVLMYLQPAQVQAVLREIGDCAPAGSVLLFDFLCWLAIGHARLHPSVRHTGAQFHWGPLRSSQLAAPHPRLRLQAEHPVMDGYGWPFAAAGMAFRWWFGVPFYGIAQMDIGP